MFGAAQLAEPRVCGGRSCVGYSCLRGAIMPDRVRIRRALVSVSDKTDLVPFARALASRGVEIISTGGTCRALAEAGVAVIPIEQVTGFPETLSGRVKTLHPKVHGGLLALRDDPEHQKAVRELGIELIDLVCVNLYPFERAVSIPGVEELDAIEQIDIGGPSLLRSAAKNFEYVTAVTTPKQYDRVITSLRELDGATDRRLRAEFAATAFARTAEYDAAIASFLSRRAAPAFTDTLRLSYLKVDDLRYGENPHQDAALYRDPASTGPTIVNAEQLHGKPLSYNNIGDASAALELVKDLRRLSPGRVGACIVKHANACGAALAGAVRESIDAALLGDPVASFGGILAVNRPIDEPAAERLTREGVFLEVVVAPAYEEAALERLKARWSNIRLLAVGERAGSSARKLDYRSIPGGMLVQDRDTRTASTDQWRRMAGPEASEDLLNTAAVAWTVIKHLKSNAVAIAGTDEQTGSVRLFGIGAGLVDRVTAARLAVEKAGDRARGAVAVSDAFFPFSDGPELLIKAGVRAIVHSGGSKRDQDTFDVCEAAGVTCLVTGVRHFRH